MTHTSAITTMTGAVVRNCSCALSLALAVALSGCYVGPDDDGMSPIIELTVDAPKAVRADGQTLVTLVVKVDPDTARGQLVTLTTSSGVLDFSADPTSADARKTTVANGGGSGELHVPLRVGRTAGTTLLSATVAGIGVDATLELGVALPQSIELDAAQTSVVADGLNKVTVHLQAYAAPTVGYSEGLTASLAVCCGPSSDQLEPCTDIPPLSIPGKVTLSAGAASVDALTRSWQSTTAASRSLWLVGELRDPTDDSAPSLCGALTDGARRSAVAIEVLAKTPTPTP